MQVFSADATIVQSIIDHEKLGKTASKVAKKY